MPVLRQLRKVLSDRSGKDWDTFRRGRPKAANRFAIYFMSPALERLAPSVRALSIDNLNPSSRTANALEDAGLETIGKLVDAAKSGIVGLRKVGAVTCEQIIDSLEALSKSVHDRRKVDSKTYASNLGFPLLPYGERRRFSPREFLKALPMVVETIAELEFGDIGGVLARQCLLQEEGERVRPADLGRTLKLSRQRIDFLEQDVLRMLCKAMMKGEYRGCHFRLKPEFADPLRLLQNNLQRAGRLTFTQLEWQQLLLASWSLARADLGPLEGLILSLVQFQRLSFRNPRLIPIIVSQEVRRPPYRQALAQTEQLLKREFVNGLSESELLKELRSRVTGIKLQPSDVQLAVESVDGIGFVKRKRGFQSNLTQLKTVRNKLERLLRENGAPMHFRDLAEKINQLTGVSRRPHLITAGLSDDPRFKPIARTGKWSLAEWTHVETRTIVEIAAEISTNAGRAFTERELFQRISKRRPIKQSSIATVLKEDNRFDRVAPTTWQMRDSRRR